jgi:hypothetical protein
MLASYHIFFANKQTAPINAAYVAAIKAGISMETARSLALWAIPGALLQILGGGPRQQLGVLFATGLLISFPAAGWMVAAGIAGRLLALRLAGPGLRDRMEVFAGGVIAGDAGRAGRAASAGAAAPPDALVGPAAARAAPGPALGDHALQRERRRNHDERLDPTSSIPDCACCRVSDLS